MPPLQLRRGCCLRGGVIPGQSPGHASWRCPFLCRLFRRHAMPPLQLRRGRWLQVFVAAPSHGAMSRAPAGVAAPWSRILIWGRGLFERSEFRSPHLSGPGQRNPEGHARAPMVLGPFAETKGPRRAGPQPRKHSPASCGAATPQDPPSYPNRSWSLRLPKCW